VIEPTVARRIRLVCLDVDGTLTDGGIYLGLSGAEHVELKRYDIQDGLGVLFLRMAGLPVVVVTGRTGDVARLRAAELEVDEFVADPLARKLEPFDALLKRRDIRWEEACFVGDDLPDLPLLRRVGLPVATANAAAEVRGAAAHTTQAGGGHGAVREFAEAFLRARGSWAEVSRTYLRERGDGTAP
jgi:3-deoxy-D-manno-octulosonate 8-phosphate phosphatase (KDO 8-P phosphatase)